MKPDAGRLLGVVSDAHGNGPALERALDVLRGLGAEDFAFLGDAVGYIPSTSAVAVLAGLGRTVDAIRGNHECMLLGGEVDPALDDVYRLSEVRSLLSAEWLAMLGAYPDHRRETTAGGRILFVHGDPADVTQGYLYPDSDLTGFAPDADLVLCGHSHHPFDRSSEGVRYVNVGSCGLPRDDGRLGAAALVDRSTLDVRVVRFDIQDAVAEVLAQVSVHERVRAVYDRRSDDLFGEMV